MAYNVLIMYMLWNGSIKLISILMTLHTLKNMNVRQNKLC